MDEKGGLVVEVLLTAVGILSTFLLTVASITVDRRASNITPRSWRGHWFSLEASNF